MILKDKVQLDAAGAQRMSHEIVEHILWSLDRDLDYDHINELALLIYEKRGKYWCPTLKEWRQIGD